MEKTLCIVTLTFTLLFNVCSLSAAPVPPVGPFDITGTISEVQWYPEQFVKGKPGASGSLGRDRSIPSHFLIKLVNYSGVDVNNAIRITRYISFKAYGDNNPSGRPPFIILKLNFKDRNFLSAGKKIKVRGYTVRGDEGGTWTAFAGVSAQ
jgi:hypothetical protein